MTNAELIAMVRSIAKHGADWRINEVLNRAAAALEADEKRIARLEEEHNKTVTAIFGEEQLWWENRCKELEAQMPKEGEWIPVTNGRGGHECSLCHGYAPTYQNGDEHLSDY